MKLSNRWMLVAVVSVIGLTLLAIDAFAMGGTVSNISMPLNSSQSNDSAEEPLLPTENINLEQDTLFDPIAAGFTVRITLDSFGNRPGFFNPVTKEFFDLMTGNIFGPSDPDNVIAGTFFNPKVRRLYSITTLPEGSERPNPIVTEEDRDLEQLPSLEELGLIEPFRSSSIIININSPCDEEWRTKYGSSWMFWANHAIELADEYLFEQFSIDFRSVAQNIWHSSTIIPGDLLDEAYQEIGRTNGADIMVAFTGQLYENTIGIAYLDYGGSLILDTGKDWNGIIVRHETGHNYGLVQWWPLHETSLFHCRRSTCLMYPILSGPSGNTTLCLSHYEEWKIKRNRY